MPYLGKNGSDAIYGFLKLTCKTVVRYHLKLDAAIDQAVTDGKITSDQADVAHTFVDTVEVVCSIFQLVAGNSGFGAG